HRRRPHPTRRRNTRLVEVRGSDRQGAHRDEQACCLKDITMSSPSDDRPPVWKRYRDFPRRRSAEDVDDELRFHLDMRVAEGKRTGMSDGEARQTAHERFGEVGAIEAELLRINRARDRRQERTAWLTDLRHDAIFSLRSLRRAPSFATAAISTL